MNIRRAIITWDLAQSSEVGLFNFEFISNPINITKFQWHIASYLRQFYHPQTSVAAKPRTMNAVNGYILKQPP